MRALNFTIGFPPMIVGKRSCGDTEYGIGAIPLGGYVKIPGMLRPEADDLYAIEDVLERPDAARPGRGTGALRGGRRVSAAASTATATTTPPSR